MFYYALLNDLNVCHTVMECNEERSDAGSDLCISIDSYDTKYLGGIWNGSEWEFKPSPHHHWDGTQWIDLIATLESQS